MCLASVTGSVNHSSSVCSPHWLGGGDRPWLIGSSRIAATRGADRTHSSASGDGKRGPVEVSEYSPDRSLFRIASDNRWWMRHLFRVGPDHRHKSDQGAAWPS